MGIEEESVGMLRLELYDDREETSVDPLLSKLTTAQL